MSGQPQYTIQDHNGWVDLRSDTCTLPTDGMRHAMAHAQVGDDMADEDPTVQQLEEETAALLGHEAALFVPSGTMANQLAIRVHTRPGDEVICEATSHIYLWEGGAPAQLSGVMCHLIPGERGLLQVEQLQSSLQPINIHHPRSRLLVLENTHNRGGGSVYALDKLQAMTRWAKSAGLARHLDGARLFNAVVASGVSACVWAAEFDSVSVCFSKGLGAPVGSALVGTKSFIAEAKRFRKVFGGAMRQAGIIAAGALYAVRHHIDRLSEDHRRAQTLASAFIQIPGFSLDSPMVDTNILWVKHGRELGTTDDVVAHFRDRRIAVLSVGPVEIRLVTHLGISDEGVERTIAAAKELASQRTEK